MAFKDLDDIVPHCVKLSKTHEDALTNTADRVVAETLHSFEQFIASNRQFDSRYWKHVKSREKVHVYRTRHSDSKKCNDLNEVEPSRPRFLSDESIRQQQREARAAGRPQAYTPDEEEDEPAHPLDQSATTTSQSLLTYSSSSSCGSFSVFAEKNMLAKVKPPNVPLVVAIGIIDGSIEDVAFGSLAHTNRTWHERNLYVKNDGFDGRKVLATFQVPGPDDPFRFVGIKWATRYISAISSRRDVLFLESSGIALDSDGDRVYYSLAHSIELDECPLLPDRYHVKRLKLSICYIMRQIADAQIEVYARGFADMGGNLPAIVGMNVFSQGIVDVVGIVEASYLKKLAWKRACRRTSDVARDQLKNCGVCGKSTLKFGKFLCVGVACAICRRMACQKCSVQKKLLRDAKQDLQDHFTFCLSCVIEARQASAWDVAMQQLKVNGDM